MKKIALVTILLLLMTGSGFAQLDPDDDGIGVYFDPCACTNCISLDVGFQTAFLVVTHPTSPQGVLGWEARMWVEGPAAISGVSLHGDEVNVGVAPDYVVGTAAPQINPPNLFLVVRYVSFVLY